MTFDHHAMVQPAVPLPGRERWTCWLDLSETYRRGRNCGETGSWRPPDEAGQSHMTSVPQTPDGKHIAVAKLDRGRVLNPPLCHMLAARELPSSAECPKRER